MRGPATRPSSMARLSPNAGPPTSRTVVKPRIKRVRRLGARHEIAVADVAGDRLCWRGPYQHRVPVRVDQAGHQRAPAAVDHGRARLGGDRRRRDAFDDVALDQHVGRRRQRELPLPSKMRTFWNNVALTTAGGLPCAWAAGASPSAISGSAATKKRSDMEVIQISCGRNFNKFDRGFLRQYRVPRRGSMHVGSLKSEPAMHDFVDDYYCSNAGTDCDHRTDDAIPG